MTRKTTPDPRDFEDPFEALWSLTAILDEPQFTKADVMEIADLTDAQLKNTIDRGLVRLAEGNNPGTGRRRMFTGGDIIKLVSAHTMSAIGFPMRWQYLFADQVALRARNRLTGLQSSSETMCFVCYPNKDQSDWVRVAALDGKIDQANLPVAYQVIHVDKMIDETMAKLRAAVNEEPIPTFEFKYPEPEPPIDSPEIDFFQVWTKDEQGRDVYVGMTFEETQEFKILENAYMTDSFQHEDQRARYRALRKVREQAREKRLRGGK